MSQSVRFGLPESVIAGMTTALTVVAMLLNSPLLTLPLLVVAPLFLVAVRRYLKRAPMGYITEGGTYSVINSTLTETVEGARTVEALGLQDNRISAFDTDIDVSAQAERYTMSLRNILFTLLGFAYDTPPIMVLSLGAVGYLNGWVTLGQITAAVLYMQALVEPLERLIRNVDRLQVGIASTSRLLGIADVPQDREAGDRLPADNRLVGAGPAVRVPERPRRAARRGPGPAAGGAAGDRRAERVGQVDARPAAVRDQRAADRVGDRRRGRADRAAAGRAADRGGPGHPGAPRLRRQRPGQHHPGPGVLAGLGGDRGAEDGRRLGLGGPAAAAAGHRARLGQHQADSGAGPADRAGPAGGRRPAHPGAGRGDVA